MSMRYKGSVISATPPVLATDAGASGAWTLEQQMQAKAAGKWPKNGPFNWIEDVFSTYLYTGNGTGSAPSGAAQTITNGVDLAGKGGLVWVKNRSSTRPHALFDTTRGAYQYLTTSGGASPGQGAQLNFNPGGVSAFNSDGFTVFDDSSSTYTVNGAGLTYTSWTFREQSKFFDIVTWTGDGTGNRTIPHSLGSTPGFIQTKRTDAIENWWNHHRSVTSPNANWWRNYATLETTNAFSDWGDNSGLYQSPDSTNLYIGSYYNASGKTYVAYLFAHNAGGFGLSGNENVISCGSFTTDGSSNATVELGWEPQFVITKTVSAVGEWYIADTMRGWLGGVRPTSNQILYANRSNAEANSSVFLGTITATGFKPAMDAGTTSIYIAIRRGPMAVPTLGTTVYNAIARTGTGGATDITGVGFPPDLVHTQSRNNYEANGMFDRLRGPSGQLRPVAAIAEQTTTDIAAYLMDGVATGGSVAYINDSGVPYINHFFRRAPRFFDEVCYTGTGTAGQTFTHNLGAVPELMIVKKRNTTGFWIVYSQTIGIGNYLILQDAGGANASTLWGGVPPTASVFTLGTNGNINESGSTFVNYLFASCPGVSKVGSYTGTGTTQAINCGFTTGARFIMIKRTDTVGDWYVWDTARGIVAGNDPFLFMNSTVAEVTNTDFIDTSAAGFELSSTAPASINASGGSYIFLAIS